MPDQILCITDAYLPALCPASAEIAKSNPEPLELCVKSEFSVGSQTRSGSRWKDSTPSFLWQVIQVQILTLTHGDKGQKAGFPRSTPSCLFLKPGGRDGATPPAPARVLGPPFVSSPALAHVLFAIGREGHNVQHLRAMPTLGGGGGG